MKIKLPLMLDPAMTEAVREEIASQGEGLSETLPAEPAAPTTDADLREVWLEELMLGHRQDLAALLELLKDPGFGCEEMEVEEAKAEGLLRACSAARLRIRATRLRDIDDEDLERGDIHIDSLEPEQLRAFLCYIFLAGLQNLVVEAIDPSCGGL